MWFGNSLCPQMTTNKYSCIKFGIIQIGVETLSQTQIPNTSKQPSFTNTNQKTKSLQISNTNCAQTKERVTNQIQQLQHTKRKQITEPQNQNQTATNLSYYSKLQPTNIKEPNQEKTSFSHTHKFKLSKFTTTHSIYIGYSSQQRCKCTIEFVMQFPCVHVHHTNPSKRQSLLQV